MSGSRLERFAPLSGVIFFVLLVVVIFVFDNNTPGADDPTAHVVSYWTVHSGRATVAGLFGAFAAIFLLWFAGSLRASLRRAEGGEGRLSALAFVGFVVVAIGGAFGANLDFMLGTESDDLHSGHADFVIQTLSALDSDSFFLLLVGLAVAMFASGLCALRFGALPKWLGWAAIVIGIVTVTPVGFIGAFGALLWVLVVSILLFLRGGETSPATTPPAPAAPTT